MCKRSKKWSTKNPQVCKQKEREAGWDSASRFHAHRGDQINYLRSQVSIRYCITSRPATVFTLSQSRDRLKAYTLSLRFIIMPSSFSASICSNSGSPRSAM